MKIIKQTVYLLLFLATMGCTNRETSMEDWPQYKNDNYRSGTSVIDLDLNTLDLDWTYCAPQAPVPAWYGPAKEDAYARSGPLPSMRDYDLVYYPVIVGTNLYYASSSDDAVHCINAKNGKEKWRFTTDGPVRMAPVYHEGKLYFGSDDGFVYCIEATRARLLWKYSPAPDRNRLVLQNGRLISFWPVRTGTLIEDGRVYFGASLVPWKKSYFCAVDIESGRPEGTGCYVKVMENMTFEGGMASTGELLIQPQGRIPPVIISKESGENKGSLPGTGGCFVLVTGDKHIVHNKSSRQKSIKEFVSHEEPDYISFKGGKEMVIKGDISYILTDNSLSALHRKTRELVWVRRNYHAHRMILSGNTLFVGATDTVFAVSLQNGLPLWKGKVEGTVYALTTAGNALFVSTGEGKISCFRPGGQKNRLLQQNLNKPAGRDEVHENKERSDTIDNLELKAGPFAEALSTDSVRITFETTSSTDVKFDWIPSGYEKRIYELPESRSHSIVLPVRKGFVYSYRIFTGEGSSRRYEYDNFFNFKRKAFEVQSSGSQDNGRYEKLSTVLKGMDSKSGLCLVIGLEDWRLPLEIARISEFDVIVLDESQNIVNDWRDMLQAKNIYGRKINALQVPDINLLPVASELANLVWVNTKANVTADQIIRLIAPGGMAVIDEGRDNWMENSNLDWQVDINKLDDGGLRLLKRPFETAGEWTHQYAFPDNSAYGGESFWGSTRSEDFEIQWMGRPGPRFQTDRSGRKPSPLAVNGLMFVQGNERIVTVDIYNGSILWTKDFPGLRRMNIHRDCSNWAAGDESIYLAIGPDLVKVNQKTGKVENIIPEETGSNDWGFISIVDDKIIGSSVPRGTHYTDYHGSANWYDSQDGSMAFKVVSTLLFTKDKLGENTKWTYKPQGVIINPTITIYNGQVCFVESLEAKSTFEGRGGHNIYENTWLTALDLNSGRITWRKRIRTMPGNAMYSMAAGDGKYVIVSSNDSKYEIYSFDAGDGRLKWKREQPWFHGNHGGHLSRPAIVGNRLVVKPVFYNLETGVQQQFNIPKAGHGCASYALTDQAVFYRGGSVTQFNFDTREFSKWERLRPDCWLSTIPAQGMVLSPEAGGGCSCGNWLETSMVMAPVSRAPITINTVSGTKPDYKQESWKEYTKQYLSHEFTDSISVEISVRPGVKGTLRYTLDDSEPAENSTLYSEPMVLNKSVTLKAAVFIEKEGKTRKFSRSRHFVRLQQTASVE